MKTTRTVISKHSNGQLEMVVYKTEIGKVKGKMKYSSETKHELINKK